MLFAAGTAVDKVTFSKKNFSLEKFEDCVCVCVCLRQHSLKSQTDGNVIYLQENTVKQGCNEIKNLLYIILTQIYFPIRVKWHWSVMCLNWTKLAGRDI